MKIYTCVEKIKVYDYLGYTYRLQSQYGDKIFLDSTQLRDLVKSKDMAVTNVKIDSNNELVVGEANNVEFLEATKKKNTLVITNAMMEEVKHLGADRNLQFKPGYNIKSIYNKALLIGAKVIQIDAYTLVVIKGREMNIVTSCKHIEISGDKSKNDRLFSSTKYRSISFKNVDTSKVTSMHSWFAHSSVEYIDFENLDTSNVVDMSDMFSYFNSIEALNLYDLDTSNVVCADRMFSNINAESIDLTKFDFSNLKTAKEMLLDSRIENITIEGANFPSLEDVTNMFKGVYTNILNFRNLKAPKLKVMNTCFAYINIKARFNLSIVDFSNVESVDELFCGCSIAELYCTEMQLPKITDLKDFMSNAYVGNLVLRIDAPQLTDATDAFSKLKSSGAVMILNLPKLTIADRMFYKVYIPEIDLTGSNLGVLKSATQMFYMIQAVTLKIDRLDLQDDARKDQMFWSTHSFDLIACGKYIDIGELNRRLSYSKE